MSSFFQSVKQQANAGLASAQLKANTAFDTAKAKTTQQNNFFKLLKDADTLRNEKNMPEYNMILKLIQGLQTDQDFLNKYYFSDTRNPIYATTYHDILTLLKSIFPEQPVRTGGVKSRKNKRKVNKKTRSSRA
jgi:hypothetical protein